MALQHCTQGAFLDSEITNKKAETRENVLLNIPRKGDGLQKERLRKTASRASLEPTVFRHTISPVVPTEMARILIWGL